MASDFFSDDFFAWEDDDDDFLQATDDEEFWTSEVESRYEHTARQVSKLVQIAINEEGTPIVGEFMKAIENCMGWRLEVVADSSSIDDVLFHGYNTYDELGWLHYMNSTQFHQLSRDVTHMANAASMDFVNQHMGNKRPMRKKIRNILWKLVKRLDF